MKSIKNGSRYTFNTPTGKWDITVLGLDYCFITQSVRVNYEQSNVEKKEFMVKSTSKLSTFLEYINDFVI